MPVCGLADNGRAVCVADVAEGLTFVAGCLEGPLPDAVEDDSEGNGVGESEGLLDVSTVALDCRGNRDSELWETYGIGISPILDLV